VGGVPDGVECLDANEIFPSTNYIRHNKSGSVAIHADAFRYQLIAQRDVIWVDADMLCMRPWDMERPYVFGWEKPGNLVCNAVMGLPKSSEALRLLNEFCAEEYPIPPWEEDDERERLERAHAAGKPVHVSDQRWGNSGPAALTYCLMKTGEMEHVLSQQAFFPVTFQDRRQLLHTKAEIDNRLGDDCYGVHLWNRRLRRRLITHENGVPAERSFLGRALIRHRIDPAQAPIPDEPPNAMLPEDQRVVMDASKPIHRIAPKQPKPSGGIEIALKSETPFFQRRSDALEAKVAETQGRLDDPVDEIKNDRILIVTGMKNEAPFILEWVAYNLSIGVTDFLVYTNDCTDNTNEILDRLAELGIVVRKDNPWNPGSNQKPQHVALKDAVQQQVYSDADWVMTIDVDEFLNIHVGDGTFADFFRAANYPNVASFTWKFFGNKGIDTYEDAPIVEQFLHGAPEFIPKPRLGWGFKSMFHKSSPYSGLGVHRPLHPDEDRLNEARWVNGSGMVMPSSVLTKGWRTTTQSFGYRLATLNHYVLRSADSYLVKRERGRINHTDQDQGLYYWTRRNYTSELDQRMLDRLPALKKKLSELLADQKLASLHNDAVAWHKGRIDHLKSKPEYLKLYEELVRPGRPDAIFIEKKDDDVAGIEHHRQDVLKVPAAAPLGQFSMPVPPTSAESQLVHARFEALRDDVLERGGFFWEGPENAISFTPNTKRLFVVFDSQSDAQSDELRRPVHHDFLKETCNASILGVMATKRNWFREPFVLDAFDDLRDQSFFSNFDEITFFGASMGGYAALAFSQVAPGSRVLVFAPQSTLDRSVVAQDDRWGWSARLEFVGRYGDAADASDLASIVQIVVDPHVPLDMHHIGRLSAENIELLRAPFMGHSLAKSFAAMTMMEHVLALHAADQLDRSSFQRIRRARFDLPRYHADLIQELLNRGKMNMALWACEAALKRRDSGKIKRLQKSLLSDSSAKGIDAAE
jgi:hypothetical protein